MQFRQVIGHFSLAEKLRELYQQNRLAHALLFLGGEGVGALPLALAFAQYLLCEKHRAGSSSSTQQVSLFEAAAPPSPKAETPEKDACGQCPSCIKVAQLIHPDLHFSYPVIPKKSGEKPISTDYIAEWRDFLSTQPFGNAYDWLQHIGAENKQGNITAAECNDIIRKISMKSYEGSYKILILWMPEYLEKEGNKLLKLIEEPPPDTLLLLVAENESLILPTILSRCQLVKVPSLENKEIQDMLMQREGLSAEQAAPVAAVAQGNYREALQVLRHADEDWQTLLRDWLNAMLKTGPSAQVKWVDDMAKLGREKQKQFLRYFTHLLEVALRLRAFSASPQNDLQLLPHELDFAERLNKIADVEQQEALVEELERAIYYIERNANAKMLFMALTLKGYHIIANKSVFLIE